MNIPDGDRVLRVDWLNAFAAGEPAWPHGNLAAARSHRIGVGFGLSGRIHRVVAETADGSLVRFVVKQDSADRVDQELQFHRENDALLPGFVAASLGGAIDADRGVIFLEDISPSSQGDVLDGGDEAAAGAVLEVIARLHAATLGAGDDGYGTVPPRWTARPMDPATWRRRLPAAVRNYPRALDQALYERFRTLPEEVASAIPELESGPATWIHGDLHLDNIVWRPDGEPVILDWGNAAVGPPAIDLAHFLTEGANAGSDPELQSRLLTRYSVALARHGAPEALITAVPLGIDEAVTVLAQGAIGWAGHPDDGKRSGRLRLVCENLLRRVTDWFR